jgi:hypothetical protein
MSDESIGRVRVGGGDRKRPRVARFFDWRKSDPKKYAGLNGLTDELCTYKNNWESLIKREGQFVLIKGREVIGVYADPEDALAAALDRYQNQKVLIKRIVAMEPIHSTGGGAS